MQISTLKNQLVILNNKYIIASAAFIIWMAFFDPKDVSLLYKRTQKLKELKQSEKHFAQKIKETKQEAILLKSNVSSLETYAREHYYMKKDNEDLFLIKDE